jgi:very-short-patch-repair endonuclease
MAHDRHQFARALRKQATKAEDILWSQLDGAQHEWFADYDAGRTAVIESFGVRVLRFANAEVCGDLDSVLTRIRAELRPPFN